MASLFILAWLAYRNYQRSWEKSGFPCLSPIPFFGQKEFISCLNTSYVECIHSLYTKAKGMRFCCIFQFSTPTLMVLDPHLIGNVLVKNFDHFHDRFIDFDDRHVLSHQLFAATGVKWKELSKLNSPMVSPGRINFLISEMDRLEQKLDFENYFSFPVDPDVISSQIEEKIVGSASLGLSPSTLSTVGKTTLQVIKSTFEPSCCKFLKFYGSLLIPWINLHKFIGVNDDLLRLFTKECISSRMKSGSKQNDVFQFFINTQIKTLKLDDGVVQTTVDSTEDPKKQAGKSKLFTLLHEPEMRNISRQIFWFLMETQGTNSRALAFVLHSMSLDQKSQIIIRKEVERTLRSRNEDQITYQVIKELKYTHQVIKECLRLYTPTPVLQRVCTKDYKIPNSSAVIPKGMKIIIPIYSIHRDPKYFSDPLELKPERFDDHVLNKVLPYTYMPFGEGPRFCIGYRFAMAHLKFCVAKIVSKFQIQAVLPRKQELAFHPFSPSVLKAKETVLIQLKKHVNDE